MLGERDRISTMQIKGIAVLHINPGTSFSGHTQIWSKLLPNLVFFQPRSQALSLLSRESLGMRLVFSYMHTLIHK